MNNIYIYIYIYIGGEGQEGHSEWLVNVLSWMLTDGRLRVQVVSADCLDKCLNMLAFCIFPVNIFWLCNVLIAFLFGNDICGHWL
jgi:hypothetical protein